MAEKSGISTRCPEIILDFWPNWTEKRGNENSFKQLKVQFFKSFFLSPSKRIYVIQFICRMLFTISFVYFCCLFCFFFRLYECSIVWFYVCFVVHCIICVYFLFSTFPKRKKNLSCIPSAFIIFMLIVHMKTAALCYRNFGLFFWLR